MNSKRRSSRSVGKTLGFLFSGKWLSKIDLSSMDRKFSRRAKSIGRLFAPKWLTSRFNTISRRLKRVEKSVATAGKMVGQVVAESPIGEGAKAIAKKGKVIEIQASRFLLKSLVEFLGALVPKPVQDFSRAISKAFWRIFGVFVVFTGRWFKTRHYWQLIGGIPAFLLFLPLAYCMVRIPFYGDAAKVAHYRSAMLKARVEKNHDAANLYTRKLAQLNALTEKYEFLAAIEEYEDGDKAAAVKTIKGLAHLNGIDVGFPAAHLWLAWWYLYDESGEPVEQAREKALVHMSRYAEQESDSDQLRQLRAYYYKLVGKPERAVDELAKIAESAPAKRLALADVYAASGDIARARAELTKVLDLYASKQANNESLSANEYDIWSIAFQTIGQVEACQQVLEQGIAQYADDEELRDRLYGIVMSRVRLMESNRHHGDAEIALLKQACELKPGEQEPLILLGQLSATNSDTQTVAVTVLDELEKNSQHASHLNAIRGSTAAEHGDYETAVIYLARACEDDPKDAQSLNNLAWVYLQRGDASLADALDLANRAIALKPDFPDYRETRGQILVRLNRAQEAISDLEFALNGTTMEASEIHRGLAEAYSQLGQFEQAAFHRQQEH